MAGSHENLEQVLRLRHEVALLHDELDGLALAHYSIYLRLMGGDQRALEHAARLGWHSDAIQNLPIREAEKPTTLDWGGVELIALTELSIPHYGIQGLHVTPVEALAMRELILKEGDVVPRKVLKEVLSGNASNGRSVDVHVRRLRGKLEEQNPEAGKIIGTVRAVGYRIIPPVPPRLS